LRIWHSYWSDRRGCWVSCIGVSGSHT